MWVLCVLLFVFGIISLLSFCARKRVLSLFNRHSVSVCGMKGCGKDLIFSFVTNSIIKKRNKAISKKKKTQRYISNLDYTNGVNRIEFDPSVLNLGGNTFDNFVNNDFKYYKYPYEDNVDFFISDAGVYFPSQYHSILDKKYPSIPQFMALSRHLGNSRVHFNVQVQTRMWDKIREHSDIYIRAMSCMVLFGRIAIQKLYVYDNVDSCISARPPFPRLLFKGTEGRMREVEYIAAHGSIQKIILVHTLKRKYDDRVFRTMLLGGKKSV